MKLLIIDDHPLVRKGLVSIISSGDNEFEIKEAGSYEDAVNIIDREKPDIAMVDLNLGGKSGIEVVMHGKKTSANTKYIMLTSYISYDDFIKAEEIGFNGFILKEALAEDILYAISLINRGKKYYDSGIIDYKELNNEDDTMNQLTEREKDVMSGLKKGLSNEEIAKQLFISVNTVKKHVSNILAKLNFTHRSQIMLINNNKLNI